MYGAILGDIIGQPYEFTDWKNKDFPLFCEHPHFTDDSVMTVAVCDGILRAGLDSDENAMKSAIIRSMHEWGEKYPHAGYGGKFSQWLREKSEKPYKSYGNGSAMRVSSVGWLFDSLERTREVARWSAEVTHNHKEGIKGAESVASAIFMARTGKSKEEIKTYIEKSFKYKLSQTCDQIRARYSFEGSCQKTCPQAITAFLEDESFEDVIRTAVSLGGDSDTIAAIAGSIAEAFYGIPAVLKEKVVSFTTADMHGVMREFETKRRKRRYGVDVVV